MRLMLAALVLILGSGSAGAQWLDWPTPGIPRLPDGTPSLTAPPPRGTGGTPDLTGVWEGRNVVGRPAPADLQPWVLELAGRFQQAYYKARPYYQCRPSGPEAERYGGWRRILQTPAATAILHDDLTYRVIHTDGRTLEAEPAPNWSGYSVGRWEGDTLVVESFGFNEKTWTSRYGITHTDQLRVTERYRRPDFGHLQVEVTYTDPGAYTRPWGFSADFALAADTEMLEEVCEKSSEEWSATLSDIASAAVTVPPDVLEKYVGVYSGIYGGRPRTFEITLSGGQLIATIAGEAVEGGLGATGLDQGAPRTLVPQSQTVFEGLGLGFRFVVGETGAADELVVIHISGPYTYRRVR